MTTDRRDYSSYMEYYLLDEPKESGTLLAGAFDALDQAYGTEPFSQEEAFIAITTVMDVNRAKADDLFNVLVKGGNVG